MFSTLTTMATSSSPPIPAVTVPLSCIPAPASPDVLLGRGSSAQKHPGNAAYRALVNANRPYYCTCPKAEKMRISRSIVAAVRWANGRFLERSEGSDADQGGGDSSSGELYHDIGDRKAVEKTSQALREGQPKLKKRIRELQAECGCHTTNGPSGAAVVVVDGIAESSPAAPCSTAPIIRGGSGGSHDGNLDAHVRAAAVGYRSPLLGEGGARRAAAAVFGPSDGGGEGAGAASSGAGDPTMVHPAARARSQVPYHHHPHPHPGPVQRTASGTPYVLVGGNEGGGGGGGVELSNDSIRNLQAEAEAGTVPVREAQMQLHRRQLELERAEEELRAQMRRYEEERERARMMERYQLGSDDLEPTPLAMAENRNANMNGGGGGGADHFPPSFQTRSIAEEIQYQQKKLERMQEEAQAQQLRLQQEQQPYYHHHHHQQQQQQQTSNNTLSQISLMSTVSAIDDSTRLVDMLLSDRKVGDVDDGPASQAAANSPSALAAAARAQVPQGSAVVQQQASPAVAAMAFAAVRPMAAETVSHVHPDPNAGPVSIWDAGESNRDLSAQVKVADNTHTSIPKDKIMGYMADDHPAEPQPHPESAAAAAVEKKDYEEPLQPERKGRRRIRRNSSVASRREIFASMKRPIDQPRRPSAVQDDSGITMSSVSSETIGGKQKAASAKDGRDFDSDVWRSEEIKAAVAAPAAGADGGASGHESKTSIESAEMDERSKSDMSKASGISTQSMMSIMTDLGSEFSLLDFDMDRSTAARLMSSDEVGQALASAGFAGEATTSMESVVQQPSQPQSHPPVQGTNQQSREETEASQYLLSVSQSVLDSSKS